VGLIDQRSLIEHCFKHLGLRWHIVVVDA